MNADWSLIAARVLLYGGTLTAFGLPAYRLLAPARARAWLDGGRWFRRGVAAASLVALAGSALHLLLLSAAMNGVAAGQVDGAMIAFVATELPVGRAALVRIGALALLLLVALAGRGRAGVAGCAAGVVACVSLAWNGHAAMNEGAAGWGHMVADQVHLLAAGAWLGALVALLGMALARDAAAGAARRDAFAAFAALGSVIVAALVLTGIVNGVMILIVPGGEPSTPYLLLLGGKIALFLGALALAANNRWRLAPALERGQGGATRRLRTSVAVELGLVAGTIVAVAWLGLLSPAA